MAYLDELLAKDEQVMLKAKRHVLFVVLHTVPYILGTILLWALAIVAYQVVPTVGTILALLLLAVSVVPIAISVYRFMFWRSEEYIVTNYRIIQVEGIFNKRTFDSALDMVNDVETTQSVFGRMFNFGTIHVITGSEVGINYLTGIDQPYAFKRALLEAKVAYAIERRNGGREQEFYQAPGYQQGPHGQMYPGYYPGFPGQPMHAPTGAGQQTSESVRLVSALAELRHAGLLSETEYESKMRQATSTPEDSQEAGVGASTGSSGSTSSSSETDTTATGNTTT